MSDIDEMRPWFIYVLRDPRDGEVRYVGFTHDTEARIRDHLYIGHKRRTHKVNWINSLLKIDMCPILETIDHGIGPDWQPVERHWIAYYRSIGARLTNMTDGGDGLTNPPPETRAKIAQAQRGRVKTPEAIEAQASKLRGKRHTQERRDLMSRLMKGRSPSDDARSKMSESRKGKKASEESRKKMSESRKGKKRSHEAIEKTRQAHIGSKRSDETRERIRLSRKCTKVVRVQDGVIFDSLRGAARENGIDLGTLQSAIKGGYRAGGYHWRVLVPDSTHPIVELKKPAKVRVLRVEDGRMYDSISEAALDTGCSVSSICAATRRNGMCAGYHWQRIEE